MLASTAVVADSARGSDRANAPRNVGHLRAEDIPAVDIVSKVASTWASASVLKWEKFWEIIERCLHSSEVTLEHATGP